MRSGEIPRSSELLPLGWSEISRDTGAEDGAAEIERVRTAFGISLSDMARMLRLDEDETRKGLVRGESLQRLNLLGEIVWLLTETVGPDLVRFWLRQPNPELVGERPSIVLRGETRHLRQLRWRILSERSDRARSS